MRVGVAIGEIALDEARARARRAAGATVLLVRQDAEMHDIAAVVARQLGKVCLVGCESLQIDLARRVVCIGEHTFSEGERLALDGNTGTVYEGTARTVQEAPVELMQRLETPRAEPRRAAEPDLQVAPQPAQAA